MTTMSNTTLDRPHDWRIVAPWYRWERRDELESERAAEADRPVIQKFVSTDFMEEFLDDPQRSVVYDARDERQVAVDADLVGGRLATLSGKRLESDGTRKLFLPSHQRFYLVTVGLHCDRPGFPRVDPSAVAEIGFVIRRHRMNLPEGSEKAATKQLQAVAVARAKARVQQQYDRARERSRVLRLFSGRARSSVAAPSAATVSALSDLEVAKRKLRTWADDAGVDVTTEGWVPTGEGAFGAWVPLTDPDELVERTYPMRRLSPAPDDPDHAAHDGTIYFAHVPTGSDEVDASGTGRFDERYTYEIVVYARRECGPCPGPVEWSKPSLSFSIASFYDPAGCAQRPIEVRLPDFKTLAASTDLPSVKMTSPVESALGAKFDGEIPAPGSASPDNASEEICFFSIPLITIVALFLLNIVLPIVVMIFSLWWMLALKFCIPPSVDIEVELSAQLGIDPGEFSVEAELEASIGTADIPPLIERSYNQNSVGVDSVNSSSDWAIGTALNTLDDRPIPQVPISSTALIDTLARQGQLTEGGTPPDFSRGVVYHERVSFDQVVHP